MYWNQVQGREVAGSSKQATAGDSGLTVQNTVDDIEEHLMSLLAVNIKYNVQTKNITENDSTTFVTLSSSSSLQSKLDHVQYMKN